MDAELQGRIVRVEASFKGRDRPKVGTGFRLAPGRVLTAQHVVEWRPEGGGVRKAAEISVSRDPDGSGKKILRRTAKVRWGGEPRLDPGDPRALDAALLEDDLPADGLEPFRRLVRLPQPRGEWEGAGFVGASTADRKLYHADGLGGEFDPVQDAATYVPLWVKNRPPKGERAGWAGVSGAPIFLCHGRQAGWLYGILRRSPGGYEDRLHAVAVTALLKKPEFCELLGIEDPPPPHEKLVMASRKLLEENPDLARQLAANDERWRRAWDGGGGIEGLLEAICRHGDVGTLLDGLYFLAEARRGERAELAALKQSAMHLVGLLAHHELLHRGGVMERSSGLVQMPTSSARYAEAMRAATEGRPALYVKPKGDLSASEAELQGVKLPVSELEVRSVNMEAGLQRGKQVGDQLEELKADLIGKDLKHLQPRDLREMVESDTDQSKRIERLAKLVESSLGRLARTKGGRPYLLLTPKKRRDLTGHLDDLLEHLGKLLPSLTYLELEGDVDDALELEGQLSPLWDILELLDEE